MTDGLAVEIHVETSITDGPGGDSALIVDDGESRLLDQNDCRLHDLAALTAHGPIDQQWLQFSGAIWYPMVYEMPAEHMRELCHAKVEAQFARATRYVQAVDAASRGALGRPTLLPRPVTVPLQRDHGRGVVDLPRRRRFRGPPRGRRDHDGAPGGAGLHRDHVSHPGIDRTSRGRDVMAPFRDKRAYLEQYAHDWAPWLDRLLAELPSPTPELLATLKSWWEPLLAMAPVLRQAIGASALLRLGDLDVLIDFPAGEVREWAGEPYSFSFDIDRRLVEAVTAERANDWSNALLLSCRFRAWRAGEFNEFLYNFFKSLSPERMARAETEAHSKRQEVDADSEVEEVELSGWIVERYCPHQQADLAMFGRVEGCVLTCDRHGWQFDLESGRCLTADDRKIRARRAE